MARFDLNLLSALDALLSERNVTKAADKLNVTQPTMSGMLLRLRHQFNDQLLVRVGRQLELTPVGAKLAGPVRDALFTVQALMNTGPQFDPATSTKTFTVLASDYCCMTFLTHVVDRLSKIAPFIRIEIRPLGAAFDQLVDANADIMISPHDWSLYHRDPRADIVISEVLFTDEFVGIADINHPIDAKPDIEQFLEYPHIGMRLHGDFSTLIENALATQYPGFRANYTVSEFMAIPYMVTGTNLIGIAQRRLAALLAKSLPIRTFELPVQMPAVDEKMLWHARSVEDPAHVWLRDLLVAEAKRLYNPAPPPKGARHLMQMLN